LSLFRRLAKNRPYQIGEVVFLEVLGVGMPEIEVSRTDEKSAARKSFERRLITLGNLSRPEISELVGYEFDQGPSTVNAQVRRYYLKLKSEHPDRASAMLDAVGSISSDANLTEPDMHALCASLSRFCSGFVLNHGGEVYHKKGKGLGNL
jgi:hypothetical protein